MSIGRSRFAMKCVGSISPRGAK